MSVVLSTFNQTLLIDPSKHPLAHAAGYGFPGKFAPETKLFDVSSTEIDGMSKHPLAVELAAIVVVEQAAEGVFVAGRAC